MRITPAFAARMAVVCAASGLAAACYADVKVEKITYLNLPNCYRLSNGTVDVVVTTDVGPRVIRYGFTGDENVFAEVPDTVVKTDLGEWKPLGGHRLWSAPEAWPRSYSPDNGPVDFKMDGPNTAHLTEPVEPQTGLQKEMIVTLAPEGTAVTVEHRITNRNGFAVDLACWGLTIMHGGGTTVIPQEPFISHDDNQNGLLAARPFVLWHFTDLTDPRLAIGKRYIRLKTDTATKDPNKIGVGNRQGWAAYARGTMLFVKRFPFVAGATYPDMGCNNETYTSADFMELETLAPMRHLNWGETAEHVERWTLYKNVDIGATEATLDAAISPIVGALAR